MGIVEQKVSAGDRPIFDLDEFLSRPQRGSRRKPRDRPSMRLGIGRPRRVSRRFASRQGREAGVR
jgi:hypothetical protein